MEVQLKAKEMFENLGYELIVNDTVHLIYSEPDDEDCIYQIRFDKVCGIIGKCKIVDGTKMTAEYYLPISFGKLKAINKQIEELGGGIMNEAVLVALGDLTNGALNYYQTTHVVMAKRKVIETYIEQLQQENKQLKEENYRLEHNEKVLLQREERAINYIDQVIGYKPCAREIDDELNVLIGILRGDNNEQ